MRRAALLFVCALTAFGFVVRANADMVAIPYGATWKYDATGTDLGTDWTTPFYTDYTWSYGPAPLGYGLPAIVTTVPYGPDSTNKYPTTYFRRAFNISVNPASIHGMSLGANYDDGFVVYVNGSEVARRSMPSGTITYDSLAIDHDSGVVEAIDLTAAIPYLSQGANYMAVELHQSSRSSPDLLWDAQLTYATTPSIVRGPYLQIGTPTSVSIRWRTNFATDSKVRYGTSVGSLSTTSQSGVLSIDHETTLTGLQPDTRYYYSVETSGTKLEGDDGGHSFLTAPTPGTKKPTRMWVIGDSGTGNAVATAVRDAFTTYTGSRDPDVWLMLGDNAYQQGSDDQYQAAVFNMYKSWLKRVVLWPTRGNHDNLFADPAPDYYDIFSMPTAGEAGGLASGTEAYYSFDYGDIHFICLDSEGSDRTPGGAMLTWLQSDLAATSRDWIIAFWHHPPYSKGSHDSDSPTDSEHKLIDMRENALPILEAGGVDLVLCGHSHGYERSMLLDGHYGYSNTLAPSMILDSGDGRPDGDGPYGKAHLGETPHEGTVYTVCGSSGGEPGGGTLDHPVMVMSRLDYGSMVIDVDGLRLDARFVDNHGAVLDSFRVVKGTALGVPHGDLSATRASLAPARPNPFEARATLAYSIPRRGAVRLSILDLSGRRVRTLVSGEQPAGAHELEWNGADERGLRLRAGVYFSRLEYEGRAVARKLILMK
jgi:hypothetical protein